MSMSHRTVLSPLSPSARRAVRAAVALATGTLVLAGAAACSKGSEEGEGLAWITVPTADAGDQALVSGTIEDQDGCMVLSQGDGGVVHLVFGDADERPQGYAAGDEVELGGGASDDLVPDMHIPQACAGAEHYWFVAPE